MENESLLAMLMAEKRARRQAEASLVHLQTALQQQQQELQHAHAHIVGLEQLLRSQSRVAAWLMASGSPASLDDVPLEPAPDCPSADALDVDRSVVSEGQLVLHPEAVELCERASREVIAASSRQASAAWRSAFAQSDSPRSGSHAAEGSRDLQRRASQLCCAQGSSHGDGCPTSCSSRWGGRVHRRCSDGTCPDEDQDPGLAASAAPGLQQLPAGYPAAACLQAPDNGAPAVPPPPYSECSQHPDALAATPAPVVWTRSAFHLHLHPEYEQQQQQQQLSVQYDTCQGHGVQLPCVLGDEDTFEICDSEVLLDMGAVEGAEAASPGQGQEWSVIPLSSPAPAPCINTW